MAACYRLWGKRDKMPCFVTRLARIGWLRHDPARPLCRCIGFDYGILELQKPCKAFKTAKGLYKGCGRKSGKNNRQGNRRHPLHPLSEKEPWSKNRGSISFGWRAGLKNIEGLF